MNKKVWIIGGLAVVVTVGALLGTGTIKMGQANAEQIQMASVTTVEKADYVDSSGEFEVHPFAELTWNTSGTVSDINVKEGDHVKTDDILMSLQTTSVPASVVSAKASLIEAQKALDDLLKSDTPRSQAWIALRDSEDVLQKAQNYRDSLNSEITIQDLKLVTKYTPYGPKQIPTVKKYKYTPDGETIANADADLALAKAKYEDAQREYDRLKDGINKDDLEIAQAKVDAAQATVNSMYILAPFDGEVLYVVSTLGDVVNPGTQAIILADTNHYYVTAHVDEADIAKVKVGQPVTITSDGLPGVELTGKVSTINPVGMNSNGLIKFAVKIALDPTESQILLGGTADVTIMVNEATSKLLVPLAAIQNGKDGEFVEVQSTNGTQKVNVTTGDLVGNSVIVSGDLKEGDQVVVVQNSFMSIPQRPGSSASVGQ